MTEYWFKPKRFGYGATPANWKGWTSLLVMVFAMLAIMRFLILPVPDAAQHSIGDVGVGLVLLAGLVVGFSVFAKSKTDGEWRWRWSRNSN